MTTRTWLLVGVVSALLLAALGWAFAPRPLEVEVAAATRGAFETAVEEDGRTRVRDRYVVSAPLAGEVGRIALREGDTVAAGDVLAVVRPAMSPLLDERSLRQQEQGVLAAEANVALAAARAERAKVALELAVTEARRTDQLARQGFVSPSKLETDRLAVQAAQRELEAAREQGHVAAHDLAQARAALAAVRRPSGDRTFALRAPVGARVLRVVQPSETVVSLGTPLIELGDTARIEVVAELLTADAVRVAPGAPVVLERWGGEGTLAGRVSRIEPGGFTKVSALGVEEQRVRVLVELTSEPQRWQTLGDGFRVGVRIVTRSVPDAVVVPTSAVFPLPAPPGASAVFLVQDGRVRITPVEVAARNGRLAWIRSGVQPGARVVVYPPSTMTDGQRVKTREEAAPV